MSTVEDDSPRGPTEQEKLHTFLVQRFMQELGFNEFQAERLVDVHADWHEAARLIGDGCAVDTAFDILT